MVAVKQTYNKMRGKPVETYTKLYRTHHWKPTSVSSGGGSLSALVRPKAHPRRRYKDRAEVLKDPWVTRREGDSFCLCNRIDERILLIIEIRERTLVSSLRERR